MPAAVVVLVIMGFIVVIAGVIVWTIARERKRTDAMRQVADQLGIDFDPEARDMPPADLAQSHLFQLGRSRGAKNLLHTARRDREVALFDYSYVIRHGNSSTRYRQTVAAFPVRSGRLPAFQLRPEGLLHRIGELFGYQDIDFHEDYDFSAKFLVKGRDEEAVRGLLTDRRRRACLDAGNVCVEGNEGWLIVYRAHRRVPAEEIARFLDEARELARAFVG